MLTARRLIEVCLLLLRDPFRDFHSEAKMLIYLNNAVKDIAERALCVESWGFLPVTKDVYRYALPDDFLQVKIVGFDSKEQGWYPLTSDMDKSVVRVAEWRYNTSYGYPTTYAIGGSSVIERIRDSVTVTYGEGVTFEGNVNFLMFGVKPDDRLLNVTDNSEAVVTGVTATRIDHSPLYGGTDNLMEVDDEFRIVSASAPLKTINLAPAPGFTSGEGEEPLSLYFARNHRPITQANIDDGNDEIELDLEMRPALEQQVCWYGSTAQYGNTNAQTREFGAEYESKYKMAWPKVNKKMRDHALQWERGVSQWPRTVTVTGAGGNLYHPYISTRIY